MFKSDRHAALDLAYPNDSQRRQATLHYLQPRPTKRPSRVKRIRLRVADAWRALTKQVEPEHRRQFFNDCDRGL